MHLIQVQWGIEQRITRTIEQHFPLDWKEDPITHRLMIELRDEFKHNRLQGVRGRESDTQLEWEVYKLHGSRETAYGDVGLLVRQRMPDGAVLEGAGFLEAKVRGRDTNKFLQVRHDQVTRLLSSSTACRLLLYDYNPVTILDYQDELLSQNYWHPHEPYRFQGRRTTHAPVLPLALAAALNVYDDSLYSYCHSLSYQICRRYLAMHDLDFTAPAIAAVRGFATAIGAPRYIIVVDLTPFGQEPPEPFRPNDNLYGALDEQPGRSLTE